MSQMGAGSDCFLKIDMSTALKERFRRTCEYISHKTGDRYSMAEMTRRLIETFCDEVDEGELSV